MRLYGRNICYAAILIPETADLLELCVVAGMVGRAHHPRHSGLATMKEGFAPMVGNLEMNKGTNVTPI